MCFVSCLWTQQIWMDPLPMPQVTALLGLFLLAFSVESWTRKERILRVVFPPFLFIHIKYKKYYIYGY